MWYLAQIKKGTFGARPFKPGADDKVIIFPQVINRNLKVLYCLTGFISDFLDSHNIKLGYNSWREPPSLLAWMPWTGQTPGY